MATTVARLEAVLTADTGQFDQAMIRSQGQLVGTAGTTERAFGQMRRTALVGGAAIAGGFGYAIKAAGDFQQELSIFEAVAGATGKEMSKVSALALKLGADIKLPSTSAKDAAQALTELAKGGLSVKDAMGAARGVLQLAAAAQIDNKSAATIAARALNAFALEGKQAVRIADLLAAASNASTAEITDIALGLRQAAASAHQLGIPVEDATTALAQMANAGIAGSDAGTSLKTMFARLIPTTRAQVVLFDELGLSTIRMRDGVKYSKNEFFDLNGNFIGMSNAAKLLTGALAGLTQEQRAETLQTLFGNDAIRASNIVLGHGAVAFDKMKEAVTRQGAAADLAAAKTAGFKGSLEAFKSTAETAGISLGLILLPAATAVMNALTFMANVIDRNRTTTLVLASVLGSLAAAVLLVNAGFKAYRAAVAAAIVVQTVFNAVVALNPFVLIILGLVALGVALVVAYQKSETFRNIVQGAFDAVKRAAQVFVDFFTQTLPAAFRTVLDWVSANWPKIAVLISGPFAPLVLLATGAFGVRDAITGAFVGIIGKAAGWGTAIKDGVISGITGIGTKAWDLINNIGSIITGAMGTIRGWGSSVGSAVKNATVDALVGIGNAAWNIVNNVGSAIADAAGTIKGWGSNVGSWVKDATVAALVGIGAGAWGIINNIWEFVSDRVGQVKGWGSSIGTWIKDAIVDGFTGLANAIWDHIKGGLQALKDRITGFLGKFNPFSGDAFDPGFVPPTGWEPPSAGAVDLKGALEIMRPFAQAAAGYGLGVTSGLRPGAITANGTPSDHGVGKALDVAGSAAGMAGFFRSLIGNPSVKQAFYDPLGSIFGGRQNVYREGGHSDHVHVATYDKGGWLKPGLTLAYNGTGGPERVGGTGSTNNVTVNGFVGNPAELARKLRDMLTDLERANGRHPFGRTAFS